MDLTRRHLPRQAFPVLLLLVAVWRVVAEGVKVVSDVGESLSRAVGAAGLLAVSAVVWLAVDRLADRAEGRRSRTAAIPAAPGQPTGTGDTGVLHLGERLVKATVPIAVVLSMGGLLSFLSVPSLYGVGLADRFELPTLIRLFSLANVVPALAGGAVASDVGRLVASALLLAAALVLAARGSRGIAELVGLVAVIRAAMVVTTPAQVLGMLPAIITAVLAVLLISWLSGRRLTPVRIEGLLVGFLLAAAFGSRQLFADPFELLIGGTAAVVIGLVWGFLTGGAEANGDTPAYPRPARVLLLLGNSTIGFGLLTYTAWARDRTNTLDLVYHQEQGDLLLGGSLLICAMFSVIVAGLRNAEIGTPQT